MDEPADPGESLMTPIINATAVVMAAFLTAVSVTLLVVAVGRASQQRKAGQRLRSAARSPGPEADGRIIAPIIRRIVSLIDKIKLKQREASEQERTRFIQAGFRDARAIRYFALSRNALVIALPMLFLVVLEISSLPATLPFIAGLILAGGIAGYLLPGLYLSQRISRRAAAVQDALSDLVDLTVICTESGLALDQALARAVREMEHSSPIVAEEFDLAALEIRAGAGRATALRNLAARVQLDDLQKLANLLIQADRFGTSIAEGLRVHSEVMRVKRVQRAEEIAARIPTIIVIPLIFCILPALLMIIMGPAVLRISTVL